MYIKLGFHNAKANLGRTIMAFLVTAAAALILTTSLSTSSGFLHGQHLLLRYYLGADIVVFPGKYVFEQGELQDANLTWQWSDYQAPWRNELPGFLLRLPQDGALQTGKNAEMVDMARVANFVQDRPEVDTVYPYYLLPSIAAFPHGGRNPSEAQGVVTPLRGRDPAVDRKWGIDKYLALDTATADEQTVNWEQIEAFYAHDGQPICIINPAALPLGVTAPRIGSTLTVYMPQFDATTQRYDWEHLTDHELYVAGHMQIPVSSYMVAERQHQPFYWLSSAIQIPLSTWKQLAQQAGAPTQPQQVTQLGLVLTDTMAATKLAHEMRQEFPEYTILTGAEMAQLVTKATSQAGLPIDMDYAFHLLTILITSLIVATNAFLLVMQRRKEIAILKSLGSSYGNIITLILAELASLSVIASFAGFALHRVFFNLSLARFGTPWSEIWQQTGRIGLQVVGTLTLASVLFGLIPAVRAARTPVMEVLRDA